MALRPGTRYAKVMKWFGQEIGTALKTTLSSSRYRFLLIAIFLLLAASMLFIPIQIIPGNNIAIQTHLYRGVGMGILTTLALLAAVSVTLQIKMFRSHNDVKRQAGAAAMGGISIITGVLSSLFASATCVACLGAAVGFLGFGTIMFLATNRWYIVAGAVLLLLLSIYLSARRINRGCEVCLVPHREPGSNL